MEVHIVKLSVRRDASAIVADRSRNRRRHGRSLALVKTIRTYRNSRRKTIKTLLSLPLAVHSVFLGTEPRTGIRLTGGAARSRKESRSTYEDAVGAGTGVVLRQKLLRGVLAGCRGPDAWVFS